MVPRSGTAAASKRENRILRTGRHRLSGRGRILAETLRQRGNSDVTNNLVAGPKLVQVLRMSKMANMVKLNPGELVKAFRVNSAADQLLLTAAFDAPLELPPTIPAPFGGHRTAAAYGCTELPPFRVRAHIAD